MGNPENVAPDYYAVLGVIATAGLKEIQQLPQRPSHSEALNGNAHQVVGEPLFERHKHVGDRTQDGVPQVIPVPPVRLTALDHPWPSPRTTRRQSRSPGFCRLSGRGYRHLSRLGRSRSREAPGGRVAKLEAAKAEAPPPAELSG